MDELNNGDKPSESTNKAIVKVAEEVAKTYEVKASNVEKES